MRRDARPTSGLKKILSCRVRDEEKERELSENREIHNKNTLGNRTDHVPRRNGEMNKNCFFPCGFLWSKPIPDTLIDDTYSTG